MNPNRAILPVLALCLCAGPAFSQPAPRDEPSAPSSSPFGQARAVAAEQLGAITGREDTRMQIEARNVSEVSDNSVSGNSVTGTISFDNSSFANLNGLSIVNANTGNNVAINSSLNVNVAIRP